MTNLQPILPFGKKIIEQRSDETAMRDLFGMLEYKRPDGSKHERKFINRYLTPLGVQFDSAGNVIKRIGEPTILWSSHTDTVHGVSGRQRLAVRGDKIKLHSNERANCLGADCTTGVWIMREMILAQVPGLYVFHRGEECGGLGSRHISANTPDLVKGIKAAIAFDRYGKSSIITHQFGGRCCSTVFSASLNDALGGGFRDDSGGSFTDTANYTDIIGECTNVSVGYDAQHSSGETQSMSHALHLRKRMLEFNFDALKFARTPGEVDQSEMSSWSLGNWRAYGKRGSKRSSSSIVRQKWDGPRIGYTAHFNDDFPGWSQEEIDEGAIPERSSSTSIERLVRHHPDVVADFLDHHGIAAWELEEYIFNTQGYVMK